MDGQRIATMIRHCKQKSKEMSEDFKQSGSNPKEAVKTITRALGEPKVSLIIVLEEGNFRKLEGNEDFTGHDGKTYPGRQRLENEIFHTEYLKNGEWQDTHDSDAWTNEDMCRAFNVGLIKLRCAKGEN